MYERKISIRKQPKHLSDRESVFGSVVIPSELLAGPLAGVSTLAMFYDFDLGCLMMVPADEVKHDRS
jgi:hypothetical protein